MYNFLVSSYPTVKTQAIYMYETQQDMYKDRAFY